MKVLIACEFSGVVRDAFRNKGIEAYSCDLLPCDPSPYSEHHIIGDVTKIDLSGYDLIIAHPPCQHLSSSGAKWFEEKRKDGRQQEGIDFFLFFTQIDCPRVCIENPIGVMSKLYRKPDQIVQPYMFGEPFEKRTCLWLKGLPLLVPTNIVEPEKRHVTKSGKSLPTWYNLPPSVDRWKIRSTTFQGIADAMANQWGSLADVIEYERS